MNSEICVFGSVSATRFGIMKGTAEDGLPRPKIRRPVGSLSLTVKVFGVVGRHRLDEAHQLLAGGVLGAPALDRGDAVLGRDRLAVVPEEAVAQREGVGELVRALGVSLDHLRLDLALLVHREEGVVDHVAVVAGDVGRGPDRIDDLEVRMHHDLQRRLRLRERSRRGARGERDRRGREFPSHVHAGLPPASSRAREACFAVTPCISRAGHGSEWDTASEALSNGRQGGRPDQSGPLPRR